MSKHSHISAILRPRFFRPIKQSSSIICQWDQKLKNRYFVVAMTTTQNGVDCNQSIKIHRAKTYEKLDQNIQNADSLQNI